MNKPKIVCLCGSVRFEEVFRQANIRETLKGNIVLSIGCNMKTDKVTFKDKTATELEEIKKRLDELHLRKIDLADEVIVLNVGGYIGHSTMNEIFYAQEHGKPITYLDNNDYAASACEAAGM